MIAEIGLVLFCVRALVPVQFEPWERIPAFILIMIIAVRLAWPVNP